MDTLTLFFPKTWNQRSLTPRWPLTPCLLKSHVWLYPRIIVSKSHGNTSMYVDTMINFAKWPHTTYYVQNEWSHSLLLTSVQTRQQKWKTAFIYSIRANIPINTLPATLQMQKLKTRREIHSLSIHSLHGLLFVGRASVWRANSL